MRRLLAALVATSDVVALLALPASVLLLVGSGGAGAQAAAAPAAAIGATAATVVRALLVGRALEVETRAAYAELVRAALGRSIADPSPVETEEGSAVLIHAASQVASTRAFVVPHLAALSVALTAVAAWAAHRLGAVPLVAGAAVAVLAAPALRLAAGRIQRAEEAGYASLGRLGRDLRVLLESPVEVRAHGREEAFAERVLDAARGCAAAERRATELRSLGALFPASVALLGLTQQARAGARWVAEALHGARAAEATVLGGVALLLSLAIGRALTSLAGSAPGRRRFAAVVARGRAGHAAGRAEPPDLARAPLALEGCAHRWPGASTETPAPLDARWEGRGVLLVGANGAGKSTLSLILLGLLAPTRGRVTWGGVDAETLDRGAFAAKVAYLPQSPFVSTSDPVAWHLGLVAGASTDAAAEAALRRTGVWDVLVEHGARRGEPPLSVPMGELSGGERKRVFLARVLVAERAELVVLDEPEAALDAAGRALVRALAEELTRRARVILVTQDERVAPDGFARLDL